MRTPVVLVAGQGDGDAVARRLTWESGTVLVEHRMDGHVVMRSVTSLHGGVTATASTPLELAHGCVSCTIRNDLLTLLRMLHRRPEVSRIVVRLAPWMEPEPVCFAINHVRVALGPGPEGTAGRDVVIAGVVTCLRADTWLAQALGDDDLDDGRTVAQVVVGQAEFADVVVLDFAEPRTLAVLRRLVPRARITVGTDRVEMALAHLEPDSRRGRCDDPHAPLLAGSPPLETDGRVGLVEFVARRPFHPQRLHDAVDLLLTGVVRSKGRLWLANQPRRVMWLESAGGGLRVSQAGTWLASMSATEVAYVNPERRAFAGLLWDYHHGDRHSSLVALVCGADRDELHEGLTGALLTDAELARPDRWSGYPDPFGEWHEDPCSGDLEPSDPAGSAGGAEHA